MNNEILFSQTIPASLSQAVFDWMGRENIRWFRLIKHLKGSLDAILKLNYKRKGIPVHPVHWREGMQVRNYLRQRPECKSWTHEEFENGWTFVIEESIKLLNKNGTG